MGQIYGRANRVIFWLGKATADVNLLMDSLLELQAEGIKVACDAEDALDKRWQDCWATMPFHDQETPVRRIRAGLLTILRRPWFRRMWILQEVAKARSAVICLGSKTAPAYLLVIAPIVLNVTPEMHCQSVLEIIPGSRTSQSVSWWTGQRNLYTLSLKFRASEATDEPDRVFTLLGISSDPRDSERILPDYRRSTKDILEDFVDHLFSTHQAKVSDVLEILARFKTVYGLFVTRVERMPNVYRSFHRLHDFANDILDMSDSVRTDLDTSKGSAILVLEEKANSKTIEAEVLTLCQYSRSSVQSLHPGNVKVLIVDDARHVFKVLFEKGCKLLFQQLIDNLAILEWQSHNFESIFADAARTGDIYILELLLKHGVDVKGDVGQRALEEATTGRRLEAAYLSITHGVDVKSNVGLEAPLKAIDKLFLEVVQLLVRHGVYLTCFRDQCHTFSPLQAAARSGSLPIVQSLLDQGIDVNNLGVHGFQSTALDMAAFSGHEDVVQLLLRHGADVNQRNSHSNTALHVASNQGHFGVVRILLSHGANWRGFGGTDRSALQQACRGVYLEVVKLLLQAGADMNESGRDDKTALHISLRGNHFQVASCLVDAGADVLSTCAEGCTSLLELCRIDCGTPRARLDGHVRLEFARMLLERGTDIHATCRKGDWAIDIAWYSAIPDNVGEEFLQLLIDYGASLPEGEQYLLKKEFPGLRFTPIKQTSQSTSS